MVTNRRKKETAASAADRATVADSRSSSVEGLVLAEVPVVGTVLVAATAVVAMLTVCIRPVTAIGSVPAAEPTTLPGARTATSAVRLEEMVGRALPDSSHRRPAIGSARDAETVTLRSVTNASSALCRRVRMPW